MLIGELDPHCPSCPMTESLTIAIGGAKAHYLETGTGRPVILLHPIPGDARTWRYNVDVLSSQFRAMALDLPSWGRSEHRKGFNHSLESQADYVAEFMKTLGLSQVSLVGASLGGLVALEFSLKYPRLVDRLVITGTEILSAKSLERFLRPSSFLRRRILRNGSAGSIKRLIAGFYTDPEAVPKVLVHSYANHLARANTGKALAATYHALIARLEGLRQDLTKISVPTLVIRGERDRFCSDDNARFLADALPNATLAEVPSAGHHLQDESPAGFNNRVLPFLRDGAVATG